MSSGDSNDSDDGKLQGPTREMPAAGMKTDAKVAEEQVEQTWWGLAWFIVITIGMAFGIVATLARDFFPRGLAPPL